jgi:hypothetical protein
MVTMRLFSEGDLRLVLEGQRAKLKQEIQSEQQDYILNANEFLLRKTLKVDFAGTRIDKK